MITPSMIDNVRRSNKWLIDQVIANTSLQLKWKTYLVFMCTNLAFIPLVFFW
jgi:hypothetical protein